MNIDEKLSVLKSFNDNDNDDEIAEAIPSRICYETL